MAEFWDKLLVPPVAFLIFLGCFYLLYWLAGTLAPKSKNTGDGKLKAYACGEDIPGIKLKFGYRNYFLLALFFTIMHVATLVVATLPGGPIAFLGLFYLCLIFVALLALLTRS